VIATALILGLPTAPSIAADPEALDSEFLDYLATCENADHNWTVVSSEADEARAPAADRAKTPAPPPDDETQEAKP
jgi:hypothetical protein